MYLEKKIATSFDVSEPKTGDSIRKSLASCINQTSHISKAKMNTKETYLQSDEESKKTNVQISWFIYEYFLLVNEQDNYEEVSIESNDVSNNDTLSNEPNRRFPAITGKVNNSSLNGKGIYLIFDIIIFFVFFHSNENWISKWTSTRFDKSNHYQFSTSKWK